MEYIRKSSEVPSLETTVTYVDTTNKIVRKLRVRIPQAEILGAALATGVSCHVGMGKLCPFLGEVQVIDEEEYKRKA